MDITVSIVDFRSLSQSDLIMRNLFSLVQIGQTCTPGGGVLVQSAKFHSGTSENPLVITLKNSQTETVMYVRNIPISAVLGQRGSLEQWVAVYPPGDPQNLSFDVSAVPKEGQPQVLVRVSIQEEPSEAGSAYGGGGYNRASAGLSPVNSGRAPAFSPMGRNEVAHQAKVDDLRRSVDSLQAELANARSRVGGFGGNGDELDITRQSDQGRDDYRPSAPAFSGGGGGAGYYPSSGSAGMRSSQSRDRGGAGLPLALVDNTVREKEEQARRIKAHVTKMSSAAQQAQDMTRRLQEHLRTLEGLRRQFQGLEMQLAEQRAATKILQRDRDQFLAEEADLLEQVRNKEAAELETRGNMNEIDRELQRIRGDSEQQKLSMEQTSSGLHYQTTSASSDLDGTKAEVASLNKRLEVKKQLVSQLEGSIRASSDSRIAKDSADREAMRAMLDQTCQKLSSARTNFEQKRMLVQSAQMEKQQVGSALESTQHEVQSLSEAIANKGSARSPAPNSRVDMDKKKSELEAHVAKVTLLEGKLQDNRQQLSDMSMKIANLHNEARDKEIAARRCEDLQTDLQRKLDEHQRMKSAALIEKEAGEGQLKRTAQAHSQAQSLWEELEAVVKRDNKDFDEAAKLEVDISEKREKLEEARLEVRNLVQSCEELDTTAITRRAVLGERQDALVVAQARVQELSRQLSQASAETAGCNDLLKRLEQDAADCLTNIEEAKQRLKQKQDDISQFQTNAVKAADMENSRVSELEKTAQVLRSDIDNAGKGELKEAAVGFFSIEESGPLADILSAKADAERDVKVLSEEHEAALAELNTNNAQKLALEEACKAQESDIESTRGNIMAQLRGAAEMEAQYQKQLADMEADAAALEAQKADGHRFREQLATELEDERLERDKKLESINKARQQKSQLSSALEKALAERAETTGTGEDQLSNTESRLKALTMVAAESVKRVDSHNARHTAMERKKNEMGMTLATISEELSSGEDPLQETMSCLSQKKQELSSLQDELKNGLSGTSQGQISVGRLNSEIEILEAKLRPLEQAAGEVASLEESHRMMSEELRIHGDRHKELMTIKSQELENSREQIEKQMNETLSQKAMQIQTQILQIDSLENEKVSLSQQVERLAAEKHGLETSTSMHEKTHSDFVMEHQLKSKEGDAIEGTVREMKALSTQLEEREGELQQTLSVLQTREGEFRSEAQESLVRLGEVRRKMDAADSQAQLLLEAEIKNLEQQREVFLKQKLEKEQLTKDMGDLKTAEANAQMEGQSWQSKSDEVEESLKQAKSAFAETTAERERCHLQMLEHSKRVKALQSERDQRLNGAKIASATRGQALELEEQLQQASDGLAHAQELLRRRKREEEEMRTEMTKLREQVRATSDKMAHQKEHSLLQNETLWQLEEERKRVESETEDLTLRLHDAEQQKEQVQQQNALLQQQVEGLYHGSMQEWAAGVQRHQVATEIARYKEELEVAKFRVEELKSCKKLGLQQTRKDHEETCEKLRERISKVQEQIEISEASFRKREATRANDQQRGMVDAPASAVPGLVVPQRPLPQNAGRRKALLVGINYATSHAPLKGCINDVWNLQCLLRYTLQYSAEQLNLLLDGADGSPPRKETAPTKANIMAGLQWLCNGARPGDSLMFVFCGYGTQHPRSPGSDQHEAYLVPSDFAADLPADFFYTRGGQPPSARATPVLPSRSPSKRGVSPIRGISAPGGYPSPSPQITGTAPQEDREAGPAYRLISLIEIQEMVAKLAPAVRLTIVFDCCYSMVPNLHPKQNFVITFPKVERGPDESAKLRDSLSRPRFLQLPVLPIRHTPRHLRASVFPGCWVYLFSACSLQEWCAEFPIEGTVQGAFTWAFLKAFAACHFHCSVYQMMRMLTQILTDLRMHFKRIEQTPTLVHSQSASMNDIVLGT